MGTFILVLVINASFAVEIPMATESLCEAAAVKAKSRTRISDAFCLRNS